MMLSLRRCVRTLALPLAVAACEDAPTEPRALLVAAEAQAALEVSAALPTLPRLIDAALAQRSDGAAISKEAALALTRARELWAEAEAAGDHLTAPLLREAAYRMAHEPLLARVDTAALGAGHAALETWIVMASGALETPNLGAADRLYFTDALREGRELLDRARASVLTGDPATSLDATLRAADRLSALSPRAVALRLIRSAEAAQAAGGPALDNRRAAEATLARADRLLRGAREALDAGEHALAIRRAYYAGQLLRPH